MQHPGFFERAGPFLLADLAARLGAELAPGADGALPIEDVRPLSDAGPAHISFVDNRKYMGALEQTKAAACLVAPPFATRVPKGTAAVLTKAPYRAFALALQAFYPESLTPKAARFAASDCPGLVHPSAVIEDGAVIEPGAVVGREARIGSGTVVAAGAVVGYRVHVGRHCYIGSCATVLHAIVGDKVYLHPGVRIGQDGFGFAMSAQGHLKVPQIGRVVIHDDVEIGANTAIDRGALNDTVIGQGTRIDNLVQIGHNVIIGRHCVIVGQVGIAGSTTLGDFVVMGGHSGAAGHVTIGTGAQIAGASHVKDDVPAGARMGGTPARPLRQYGREIAALARLARGGGSSADAPDDAG